ncbi:MAG: hypothetical protein AAGE52_27745, partial [Myxococcota bacterium]
DLELGTGTTCRGGSCICGDNTLGCLGVRDNWCCPPRTPSGTEYCANLEIDPDDCGACDERCDPARSDRCEAGTCRCGLSRESCTGERDSVCCESLFADVGCVNIDTDNDHCGRCQNRCPLGRRCEEGVCVMPGGGVDAGTDAGAGSDAGEDAAADASGV